MAHSSGLRTIAGFAIAPGVPALILCLLQNIPHQEALLLGIILITCAYVAALLLGVPMHLLLRRKNLRGFVPYLTTGALIGLTFYVLLFGIWALASYWTFPEHAILLLRNSIMSGVVAVVYAAVAAALFWAIAIGRKS